MPGLLLLSQGYVLASPRPFNDFKLSLKGCADLEGETDSDTEKRLKKQKNKTAQYEERFIFTHFSGFPLYQFRYCDISILLRVFS